MSLDPNNEILINDTHTNKFVFVLDRIPTSYLISKFSSFEAEECITLGLGPDDIEAEKWRESNIDLTNFRLYLQSFEIPSVEVQHSVEATQFVDIPHVDGKLNFGTFNTNIKIDENWIIYDMILYWFYAGFNPEERMKFKEYEYYKKFYVGGTLIILDDHMNKCKEFSFTDLHPVSHPSINLTETEAEKIILPVTWIHTGFVPSDRYVIRKV